MLYDYKFTLAQMGQLKNYKKEKKFEHLLLDITDIELSTYEIDCEIRYKKTVPLNMFEKYSIRLIEKAQEINSEMNIDKIAKLLHLDNKLIRENLENLEAIDMLHGVNTDMISINRDENASYLEYENKFKIESDERNYHLTQKEYEDIDTYILKEFDKDSKFNDRKFKDSKIIDKKLSTKNVNLLRYSDNQFLIFSKDGVNQQSDLKFIDSSTFESVSKVSYMTDNCFCHYEEFLPLLRDKLYTSKGELIVIGSKDIVKENLNILPSGRDSDIYILSNSTEEYKRVINITCDDFAWIGDSFFIRNNDFIIETKDIGLQTNIKNKLKAYFISKILEIEPKYNQEKIEDIEKEIIKVKDKLDEFKYKNKKEIEEAVKKINEKKNKLYGLTDKNVQTRSSKRKKIDKLESKNNQIELEKYPIYLENRDEIFELKNQAIDIQNQIKSIEDINQSIAKLNNEKSALVSKENKQKVAPFEKELKNLERLKL